MPYELTMEPDHLGIVVTLSGVVPGDEIYRLNEQLMADEWFAHWRYQIWDFVDVQRLDASFDQLRAFAMQDGIAAGISPGQRIALISPPPPIRRLDRVFHIFQAVWGGYESKTFYDLEAARAWAAAGGP